MSRNPCKPMMKRLSPFARLSVGVCLACLGCRYDEAPENIQVVEIESSNYTQHYAYDHGRLSTFSVSTDHNTYTKFNYDGARLAAVDIFDNNVVVKRTELSYDDRDRRVSETDFALSSSGDKTAISTNTFTYDDAGHLILKTLSPVKDNQGNPAQFHFEFEYVWEAGNVVVNDRYYVTATERRLLSTYEYTYDTKHNPANQSLPFVYIGGFEEVLSQNNIIQSKLTQGGELQYDAPTIYVYNDRDYPDQSLYTQIDPAATTIISRKYRYQ